ncbi:hypothetical protein ACFSS8_14705 [Paracoccus kondratievae]
MLEAKFTDCARATLTDDGAAQVFALLMRLDALPRATDLTDAIQAATR